MPVYSIQFTAVTVSVAQDLFEIVNPTAGVINILGYEFFQISDFGDAQSEGLSLLWIRGYTTTGSGGTSVTPVLQSTRDGAASATCKANNTTVATAGGSITTYMAGGFNAQGGAEKWWPPQVCPVLRNSERGVLRMSAAPGDPLTMNGTLYFEEL